MQMQTNGVSWSRWAVLVALAAAAVGCADDALSPRSESGSIASARLGSMTAWSPAVRLEAAPPGAHPNFNTTYLEGCPSTSRDGLTFYIASTRPGGHGGIDIWVSRRRSVKEPWGEPVNAGERINSPYNDFCPMPSRQGTEFYFVSNRPGGCGGDDIYITRILGNGRVEVPHNIGCDVNSPANEAGPVPLNEPGRGPVLYFSSTRAGGFAPEPEGSPSGDSDLYSSERRGDHYGRPSLVANVNSAYEDGQPYIQGDATEIYFYSTRPGGFGAQDIWMASRSSAHERWREPVNLGEAVNTSAGETRPSLSWDGQTLFFGSSRFTGEANIYVSFRDRVKGGGA